MKPTLKLTAGLLSLIVASCGPPATDGGSATGLLCELVAVKPSTDSAALATFRVTNGTDQTFSYHAYTKEGPLYQCEVLQDGVWQASPLGWCGTGLRMYPLEPGESVNFDAIVPAGGRSYRFTFGELPVVSPAVTAP